MNVKVDISVCRVCMKSETGTSLFKDTSLLEKFVYTTKLKVKSDDSMPVILCDKCVSRLKVAHDFCRAANLAEKHLRKFLSKISLDFREVTKTLPNDDDEENFMVMEDLEDQIGSQGEPEEPEEIFPTPLHHQSDSQTEAQSQFEHQADESNEMVEEILGETMNGRKRNLKIEVTDMENNEEIEMMIEDQQAILTIAKEEALTSEIQMEEFHEIIPDEDNDTNLYLDENTYEELQLYEAEDGEVYENVQKPTEDNDVDEIIAASQLDSSNEIGDETEKFDASQEENKSKGRRSTRNAKRSGGESAAAKIESKSNICIKCNKDFSTKTNLMRHMSTHDGVKPYTCPTCGKGFTQNGSLKQHIFIHTGEKPHVCNVCQRGFTQSKSLIFHMRRHTGEKPFNCEECGINFRQKDGLKHHIQKYHKEGQDKQESHVCPMCERILSSKYALAAHIKNHQTKIVEQETEILEKCFNGRVKEVKRVSPASTSKETVESKDLAEAKLTTHAAAGVRMKQFQCGLCFKSFHIKRNLLHHLRNHDVSSLDLHECTDCGIGFDTKRSLKLHRMRDHKEVVSDLNTCEYCNAPFVSVADLSEHIANEHDAIDQNCPHCNEHFTSQKLYYDHLLEHEHMLDN